MPLFTDAERPQLVVEAMKCGLPTSLALKYSYAEAVTMIEQGQDDAVKFFSESPPAASRTLKMLPGGGAK